MMYLVQIVVVVAFFFQRTDGSNTCAKHLADYAACTDKEKQQMRKELLDYTYIRIQHLKSKIKQQKTALNQHKSRVATELHAVKTGQSRLQTDHTNLQSRLEKFRCQVGEHYYYRYPTTPPYPQRKTFTFSPPFEKTPSLLVTVRELDEDRYKNLKFKVHKLNVTKKGFTLMVTNFHKGLYGATAVWMACPS